MHPSPPRSPPSATTAPPRSSVSQSEAEIPLGTPGVGNPVGILWHEADVRIEDGNDE